MPFEDLAKLFMSGVSPLRGFLDDLDREKQTTTLGLQNLLSNIENDTKSQKQQLAVDFSGPEMLDRESYRAVERGDIPLDVAKLLQSTDSAHNYKQALADLDNQAYDAEEQARTEHASSIQKLDDKRSALENIMSSGGISSVMKGFAYSNKPSSTRIIGTPEKGYTNVEIPMSPEEQDDAKFQEVADYLGVPQSIIKSQLIHELTTAEEARQKRAEHEEALAASRESRAAARENRIYAKENREYAREQHELTRLRDLSDPVVGELYKKRLLQQGYAPTDELLTDTDPIRGRRVADREETLANKREDRAMQKEDRIFSKLSHEYTTAERLTNPSLGEFHEASLINRGLDPNDPMLLATRAVRRQKQAENTLEKEHSQLRNLASDINDIAANPIILTATKPDGTPYIPINDQRRGLVDALLEARTVAERIENKHKADVVFARTLTKQLEMQGLYTPGVELDIKGAKQLALTLANNMNEIQKMSGVEGFGASKAQTWNKIWNQYESATRGAPNVERGLAPFLSAHKPTESALDVLRNK